MTLELEIISPDSDLKRTISFEPTLVVCAEFCSGRQVLGGDQKALFDRSDDRMGSSPHFYPVSPYLLTNRDRITVQGRHTSGEVEYVALRYEDEVYVSVGSDHCDRQMEPVSIAKSKQLCSKVIARQIVLYRDLRPHWDEVKLSSEVESHGRMVRYQFASVVDLMRIGSLIRDCSLNLNFDGAVLFSGTVPTIPDIPAFSPHFYFRMDLQRFNFSIAHHYAVEVLPESA